MYTPKILEHILVTLTPYTAFRSSTKRKVIINSQTELQSRNHQDCFYEQKFLYMTPDLMSKNFRGGFQKSVFIISEVILIITPGLGPTNLNTYYRHCNLNFFPNGLAFGNIYSFLRPIAINHFCPLFYFLATFVIYWLNRCTN